MGWLIAVAVAVVIVGLIVRQELRAKRRRHLQRGADVRGHTPDPPPGDGFTPTYGQMG